MFPYNNKKEINFSNAPYHKTCRFYVQQFFVKPWLKDLGLTPYKDVLTYYPNHFYEGCHS
jgi:hypothetical protein